MKTRPRHSIAQQFFDATERDDDTFLRSLAAILRIAKRPPAESEADSTILRQLSDTVAEEPAPYDAASLDNAPYTVGEALQQFLKSNSVRVDDAARQLGIPPAQMQSLVEEMMPLTGATVPAVARFFGAIYGLKTLTLRQWLITGLRELEMKSSEHGCTRIAARRKKP